MAEVASTISQLIVRSTLTEDGFDNVNGAPSGLSVTALSPSSTSLSFTIGSTNHEGHSIERSTDNITYTVIASVTGNTLSYTDTGLTGSTLYYYRVRAYRLPSYSSYCTPASATTWNAVFTNITRAWPLSEAGMRRESLGSNNDFYPVNMTSSGGYSVFNGSSSYLVCGDGDYHLDTDTSFTISFTMLPTNIGGTKFIMTKGLASMAGGSEWYLYHNSDQIFFRVISDAAEVTVTDSTNRVTVGVASKITAGFDAANNVISIKIDNNTPVTAAYNNATRHDIGGIVIGTDGTRASGNTINGSIRELMIWTGTYLTAAQQATLFAQTFPYSALAAQAATLDPDDLDSQYSRHDFSDISTMFQNTTKTVSVATNGNPIRVIESLWNTHDWTAPSDAVRPLYQTNILGGLGVGLWNGTDSELNFDDNIPGGDDFTLFIIAQNSDNTTTRGSQILHSSDESNCYLAYTGTDYGGGCYAALHTTTGDAVGTDILLNNPGFNLVEIVNDSGTFKIMANGRIDAVDCIGDLPGAFTIDEIGPYHTPGWWFDGYAAEIIIYSRALTDAEKARIRANLTSKWSLSNTVYMQA